METVASGESSPRIVVEDGGKIPLERVHELGNLDRWPVLDQEVDEIVLPSHFVSALSKSAQTETGTGLMSSRTARVDTRHALLHPNGSISLCPWPLDSVSTPNPRR